MRKESRVADQPGRDPEDEGSTARTIGMGVMVPTTLAACVLVGCFVGYLVDKWLGSSPWGLVVGLILGAVAGVREMLKILKKIQKD